MAAMVRFDFDVPVKGPFLSANDMQIINEKEICLPLNAIISMQINPYTFLCHLAVLDCRNLFLS